MIERSGALRALRSGLIRRRRICIAAALASRGTKAASFARDGSFLVVSTFVVGHRGTRLSGTVRPYRARPVGALALLSSSCSHPARVSPGGESGAVRGARVTLSRLTVVAFVAFPRTLRVLQFALFEEPIPVGDPGAYLEMGGKFAEGMARLGSPLGSRVRFLSDLQPYLALPATGLLYGLLIASSAASRGSICRAGGRVGGDRGGRAGVDLSDADAMGPRVPPDSPLVLAAHSSRPSRFSPAFVQPEPFILAAWTLAARLALHSSPGAVPIPAASWAQDFFSELGLALHPQGLSFLLLALALCALLPWIGTIGRRPSLPRRGGVLGVFVRAPSHCRGRALLAKPLAHVLDKQYGFFAYTSPHPLGFWLYTDSSGWQGPLRIEDTTYQKELLAMKGAKGRCRRHSSMWRRSWPATRIDFGRDVVLTNLHRLWHRPDNPFQTIPFRSARRSCRPRCIARLVVLFVISACRPGSGVTSARASGAFLS